MLNYKNQGYFLETADVTSSLPPIQMKDESSYLEEYAKKNKADDDVMQGIRQSILSAPQWLPYSSSVYKTSANVEDYFTVPTIIMPSDLPNRNMTAFPREELTRFDPEIGDHVYKGWIGKPVYTNHINNDYTKALGAVVDASMKRINNTKGDIWKVVSLLAIDRTKNPKIARDIQEGRRTTYSMGALVKSYSCSVCSAKGYIRPGIRDKYEAMPCGREHAFVNRQGGFREFAHSRYNNDRTIGFLRAHDVKPFEVSTVDYPAFASAYTRQSEIKEF